MLQYIVASSAGHLTITFYCAPECDSWQPSRYERSHHDSLGQSGRIVISQTADRSQMQRIESPCTCVDLSTSFEVILHGIRSMPVC